MKHLIDLALWARISVTAILATMAGFDMFASVLIALSITFMVAMAHMADAFHDPEGHLAREREKLDRLETVLKHLRSQL